MSNSHSQDAGDQVPDVDDQVLVAGETWVYLKMPLKLHEALLLEADRRRTTVSRTVQDLLTASLVSRELAGVLPAELEAYLNGRRMFAMLAGLLDAAVQAPERTANSAGAGGESAPQTGV